MHICLTCVAINCNISYQSHQLPDAIVFNLHRMGIHLPICVDLESSDRLFYSMQLFLVCHHLRQIHYYFHTTQCWSFMNVLSVGSMYISLTGHIHVSYITLDETLQQKSGCLTIYFAAYFTRKKHEHFWMTVTSVNMWQIMWHQFNTYIPYLFGKQIKHSI